MVVVVLYLFACACCVVCECVRWSVEQGLVRGCLCVGCEVCVCLLCVFVCCCARVALLAHPLTTLLCAAVVDDGARCVQFVSLPPLVFLSVCSLCVVGGGVCCVFGWLCVIMCVRVRLSGL